MNIDQRIIEFVRSNRLSTTEVADAMGKTGLISGPQSLNLGQFRVGRIHLIFTANQSNYAVHEQIRRIEKGEIVFIFAHNCNGRAIIGELIAKYALLHRGAEAVVIDGLVRDAGMIYRQKYPIWATGVSPIGCFNQETDPFPKDEEERLRREHEGGVVVADDGGVIVIPRCQHSANLLARLEQIEVQEGMWNYCMDTLKWDTKKIVCDKAYFDETELLPDGFIKKLGMLRNSLDKAI